MKNLQDFNLTSTEFKITVLVEIPKKWEKCFSATILLKNLKSYSDWWKFYVF